MNKIKSGFKALWNDIADAWGKLGWLGLGITLIAWYAFPSFFNGVALGVLSGYSIAMITLPKGDK